MQLKAKLIKTIRETRWRFRRLFDDNHRFLSKVSGVIHLGANVGQERFTYHSYGLNVLWIEPNPEIFPQLQQNILGLENQAAIQALITDEDDQLVDFNISSNGGESSSILDLEGHVKMWPEVRYTHIIKLRSITLPSLVDKFSIRLSDYEALVMDIQGAELIVLNGAKSVLSKFKFIKLEVPDFRAYSGCCTISEVGHFMKNAGFFEASRCEFKKLEGVGCYYDVIYAKKS
jgi:FkbM family methyltransferase